MINISEYLNENLDEFVFELKNQTYLNACLKRNGRMKGHEGPISGTN